MNNEYYKVDEEEIRKFFLRKKPIIPIYKILTLETIELLRKYGKSSSSSALCGGADYWEYEIKCKNCGKVEVMKSTRRQLLEYITKDKQYYCNVCNKERISILEKEQQEKEEKKKIQNLDFIKDITNPQRYIVKGKYKEVADDIKQISYKYENEIAERINKLSYNEFLQTPYWKAISSLVRTKAKRKCAICNSDNAIHIHHKTYIHHGKEMLYLNDLINLCNSCHSKFHEVEK